MIKDDQETYTVEDYVEIGPTAAFVLVENGEWSLNRFREWHSAVVGQSVKNAIQYLKDMNEMLHESSKRRNGN